MKRPDNVVVSALAERILEPARLRVLLADCLDQSNAADVTRHANLKTLRTEKSAAEVALAGLYRVAAAIDAGLDPVMKGEIEVSRTRITALSVEILLVERQLGSAAKLITPEIVEAFGDMLRKRLVDADPTFCQSYARLLIDRVEVGTEHIDIAGLRNALAQCAVALKEHPHKVPIFEREWCARRESNPRPAV